MKQRLRRRQTGLLACLMTVMMLITALPALADSRPPVPEQEEAKPATSSPAPKEEERPTADVTVTALNLYYSKGVASSRHSIVIQPSITIGYKDFSLNLWGNLDTNPYPLDNPADKKSGRWTETDVTIAYNEEFGVLRTGLSYIYTGNGSTNANGKDQHDLALMLGLAAPLNPALNVFYMFDNSQRWYFMLGIGHTIEFNKAVSLKLAASAAYMISDVNPSAIDAGVQRNRTDGNGNILPERYNNFLDGMIGLTLPIKAAKYFTVTPGIAYAFPLGKDAENYMKNNSYTDASMNFSDKPGAFLIGSIAVSFAF
jgi:hypothetical protein